MGKKRIMFVDDEPEILEILQDIFDGSSFEIVTAGTGEKAIRLVRESLIDLILCDLKLPDISGIEVLKKAKERQPGVMAILTTGYYDPLSHEKDEHAKVIDKFIPKPWDILSLKREIQNLLSQASANK